MLLPIARLAETFSARDLMVARMELVTAETEKGARVGLERHPDFNLIPIESDGVICSYLSRDRDTEWPVTREDLVSEGTPILDLLDELASREFLFVLSGSRIAGYVHYSDLNNPIVKLPFYLLFEAVERHLLRQLAPLELEPILREALRPRRTRELRKHFDKLQDGDVSLGPEVLLYFAEILQVAGHAGFHGVEQERITVINDVRTRVSHAGRPLIRGHADVAELADVRAWCDEFQLGAGG